ncbi:MAG TPA: zincin-like metallopeptidase domain-containing protein [Acetobacteraceae bacterium]|nr:zincin-like metallopeptidase domain-containing protein [Acetobacteraceae bacterium]
MATDYVDQVAGAIIEQLKVGTAPWVKPWQAGERFMPYNPTTGNAYRGMNAVWLMSRAEACGYDDARWMTYRQAQAAGAQVRKGEKGSAIQFWKWEGLEPVRDAGGEPVLDQDGNQVRRMVRYERPRVWTAAVFNAAQIDGLPPAPSRPALAEWERHERADTILTRLGASIRHVRGDSAFYRLADDTIVLPERGQFPSGDRYYATALHEASHASGHPSRLNRDIAHPFGSEVYAREELRAEIASLMLGEQLGIGHDPGQHAAYVGTWIRVLQNDPREIFRAAADAEKITTLLRSLEREHAHEADPAPEREQSEAGQGRDMGTNADVRMRPPVMIQEDHPAMTTTDDRTYLAVPYAEKDDAKQLGARWDRQAKAWYVPAGVDLDAFTPWLPVRGSVHIAVDANPVQQFAEALRECGLRPDGPVQMDGQMHRVPVEGDKGRERSGAYVGHQDGKPAGFIQNFKAGVKTAWKATGPAIALSAEDRARMAAEAAQRRHERALERERMYERTAQEVDAIWAAATPVEAHPYLADKQVPSHGLRQGSEGQAITVQDAEGNDRPISIAGRLMVPVMDASDRMTSLQFIDPAGGKMFMPESRVEGGHFAIGDLAQSGALLIAEGYATAATLHELTGMPAVVAFNAGNLVAVAQGMRTRFPDRPIYIAGDNDHRREAEGKPNVGREKAEEAAAAIDGFALVPTFAGHDTGSDWNDLTRGDGPEAARRQFAAAVAVAEREQIVGGLAADRDRGQAASTSRAFDRERVAEAEMER